MKETAATKKSNIIPLEQQFKVTNEILDKYLAATGSPLDDFQRESFKQMAIALNLNPILREIHAITYQDRESRKTKMSIVIGYEVYIKRSERTALLDGWEKGIGYRDNEKGEREMYAWVKIYRKDWSKPFYHEVTYDEYVQKKYDPKTRKYYPIKMWRDKPRTMLQKVAIAQGFRLAFPEHLGGLPYAHEEMEPQEADYTIVEDEIKGPLLGGEKEDPKPEPTQEAETAGNSEKPREAPRPAAEKSESMKKMDERTKELFEFGFRFDGKGWSRGDVTISTTDINESDPGQWTALLQKLKNESEPQEAAEPPQESENFTVEHGRKLMEEWAKNDPKVNAYFNKIYWILPGQTVADLTDKQVQRYFNSEDEIQAKFKAWKKAGQ